MDDPRAQRTLVKSPPELWAEISDAGALAGHLGAFGDIRITRLVPETTVAWEGDRARGTVELEPAGWGTRVTLTAHVAREEAVPHTAGPAVAIAPAPAAPGPAPASPARDEAGPGPGRWRFLGRLLTRRRDPAPEARTAIVEPAPAHAVSPRESSGPALGVSPEPHTPPVPDVEPAECSSTMPAPLSAGRAEEILTGVLDDLGAARHRPFSRG
jgi:hypothetical protein